MALTMHREISQPGTSPLPSWGEPWEGNVRGAAARCLFQPLAFASFARTAQRGFGLCGFSSQVMYVHPSSEHLETKPSGRALTWSAVRDSLVNATSLPSVPQGLPLHCRRKPEATGISQEAILSIVQEMLAGGVQDGWRGKAFLCEAVVGARAHVRFLAALVVESLARTPWRLKA